MDKYILFTSGVRVISYMHRLLFISSICKSNCDRVPTNDFLHAVGEWRLSLEDDLLIELSRSNDIECLMTGLCAGLVTVFTLLCTVTLFTITILPFFRPSFVYTSRSSSTSSNDSSPEPKRNPPPTAT